MNEKLIVKIQKMVVIILISMVTTRFGIYNTPVNKLSRQISLGNKYLLEERYEEAVLAFEQAIAIDEKCVEAYVGGIEAYLNSGDENGLVIFYDRAISAIESVDGYVLEKNKDNVIAIYLYADEVYANATENAIKVLESGFELVKDFEIQSKLIENYYSVAAEEAIYGNYEESLAIYDKLLELTGNNTKILLDLEDCLSLYLEVLMRERSYEKIQVLALKYEKIVKGINFEEIIKQIEELNKEQIVEVEKNIIQKADINNLLECINECRIEAGLSELVWSSELEEACKNAFSDFEAAISNPGLKHSWSISGPDTAAQVVRDDNMKKIVLKEEWNYIGGAVEVNQNGFCTWILSFN